METKKAIIMSKGAKGAVIRLSGRTSTTTASAKLTMARATEAYYVMPGYAMPVLGLLAAVVVLSSRQVATASIQL